jgi:GAF domain-containing protein
VYHVCDSIYDARAQANSLVAGPFGVRFYAAAPLCTHDGFKLGTLSVADRKSRELAPAEAQMLRKLAALVMDQIELRWSAIKIAEARSQM